MKIFDLLVSLDRVRINRVALKAVVRDLEQEGGRLLKLLAEEGISNMAAPHYFGGNTSGCDWTPNGIPGVDCKPTCWCQREFKPVVHNDRFKIVIGNCGH